MKYLPLILLLILAFGLRVYDLGEKSYWIDESYSVLAAQQTLDKGIPEYDSGFVYDRALIQTYFLAGIGWAFGFGEVSMRFLSVLAGIVSILILYLLVEKMYSRKNALIASIFMTFSQYQIVWARQARMYIFAELFVLLCFYWYYEWYKTGKKGWLSIASFIIAYTFHPIALVVPFIIGIHLMLTRKNNWKVWSLIFSGCLISLILGYRVLSKIQFLPYKNFFLESHYILLFLGCIGLVAYKKKENILVGAGFGLFLLSAILAPDINFRYVLMAQPFLYIAASEGIVYFWKRKIILTLIIVTLIVSGFFVVNYSLEVGTPQPPFRDAYENVTGNVYVSQPAISRLYYGKAKGWIAFSYNGRDVNGLITDNGEIYDGIPALVSLEDIKKINGTIIIDDMGLQRISLDKREEIMNSTLIASYGDSYWNKVYVYEHIRK